MFLILQFLINLLFGHDYAIKIIKNVQVSKCASNKREVQPAQQQGLILDQHV